MTEVKYLVEILKRYPTHFHKMIQETSSLTEYQRSLLNKLIEHSNLSQERLFAEYYVNSMSPQSFRKLKDRLKVKLINHILIMPDGSSSEAEKRVHLFKDFTKGLIMWTYNDSKAYLPVAKKIVKVAGEMGEYEIQHRISKELFLYYSRKMSDAKQIAYYSSIACESLERLIVENRVISLFGILSNVLLTRKRDNIAEIYKDDIQYVMDNYTILENGIGLSRAYGCIYIYNYFTGDAPKLVEIAKAEVKRFAHSKTDVLSYLANIRLAIAYISNNQLSEALMTLTWCLTQSPTEGSGHWFSTYQHLFMVHILKEDYVMAHKIFLAVANNKRYSKLSDYQKEAWGVKEAFMQFLIRIEKIPQEETNSIKERPRFGLGKFMNEVPNFSKDKRGQNVTLIILQILFMLTDRKYEDIIDRIDALKQYSFRYLRHDSTYRSNCFVKMLMKLPDGNYHPVGVKRHTETLLKKLSKVKLDVSEYAFEAEIIPYEKLWNLVMETLERNLKK